VPQCADLRNASTGSLEESRYVLRLYGRLSPAQKQALWEGKSLAIAQLSPALRPLVYWLALVYAVFTFAATKMQSYVLIAAPVVFVALGGFAIDALRRDTPRGLRALHALAALALVAGAALAVLRVEGPFEEQVRDPLWARELRWLGGEVEKLPPGKRAVFGVPWPVECMYYARATCLSENPTPEAVTRARAASMSRSAFPIRAES
jgi:hypothetical protein